MSDHYREIRLSKVNNFDLIRLLAAIQVVVLHTGAHLHVSYSNLEDSVLQIIKFFPGVPIFFTISGFLIMWSYERNKEDLFKFYKNRLLRIFPALWVCLILTVFILLAFRTITIQQLLQKEMIAWLFTQCSFFQFYTPDLLRSFGVGTPNGSLWTISLELQFYLIVPILYWLLIKPAQRIQYLNAALIIAISIFTYSFADRLAEEGMLSKLMGVFLLPYLYNFIFGILIYNNWKYLEKILVGKAGYWIGAYLLYSLVCSYYYHWYQPNYWPNAFGFVANLVLAFTVISAAYTKVNISHRLLKDNDFSYGIYIYHMLIVNIYVEMGYTINKIYLIEVFFITLLLAVLSWFLVERPILRQKKNAITNRVHS